METFLATLTPMLTLFTCIAIGFILSKTKILPDTASKTMAKLETWVFLPCISFMSMLRYCTPKSISTHGTNIILSSIILAIAMLTAITLAKIFVKEDGMERGVYKYGLTIANISYVGDPIILALFGEQALAYYKLFCLPLLIVVYTWGISILTPKVKGRKLNFKSLLNAPTIALLVGVVMGLLGIEKYLPSFLISSLDALKSCMAPVAMLLAGVTIAKYNFVNMLKNKKVYIATALRLIILPSLLISILYAVITLANLAFNLSIGYDILFLCFFAYAAPLGLNTIVFPEAFGGSPETGASMAMISHTLCVISIPILYAIMVAIFGVPFTALI